ncbi:hypothetical protein Leryth_026644 [Lithospermum erythrorhizon]|uniref:X8 domain-containing protein n=1 Tax=Lithospermum erythrorhizon TaxID=34254 RepID=A0AAV3S114_LITER|nr:hypothetical protein Leryth_026644 [Lithospermum erythrorhizon]
MAITNTIFWKTPIILLFLATLCAAEDKGELWCVAKNNAEDAALQSALDWACGAGGANCASIQPGGQCYDSSDIVRTASYAFNDYFLQHGMSTDTCNFSNCAELTSLNPSFGNCKIPSSSNVSKGSFTGGAGTGSSSGDSSNGNSVMGRLQLAIFIFPLFFIIPMIDP